MRRAAGRRYGGGFRRRSPELASLEICARGPGRVLPAEEARERPGGEDDIVRAFGGSSAVEDAVVLADGKPGPVAARRQTSRWLVEKSYQISKVEQPERPLPRLVSDSYTRFAPPSVPVGFG